MLLDYLPDVTTLAAEPSLCVGCGMCTSVCPRGVLALEDGRVSLVMRDRCIECGACATNCPTAALSVRAGVGCAAAIINRSLGRGSSAGGVCC